MNKEFEFLNIISNTLSDSSFLGNDCAYLDEYKIALSKDCLIEDIHFSLKYMTPYEIARKALLVNISDILASGSKPKYILIGLCGKLSSDFIQNFYKGINDTCEKYNIKVIGGDLTKADKISISITIIGDYKNRNISQRNKAQKDYVIATVGEFGSSSQGLYDLEHNIKDNYFIEYHKNPVLYPEISEKIAQKTTNPYAMMDSSDGLVDCLIQISNKSNLRIDVAYDLIPKKTTNRDFVLYGGEDYSLVLAIHKDDFKKIKGLTKIGTCSLGCGVFIDNKKIEHKGYNHFE